MSKESRESELIDQLIIRSTMFQTEMIKATEYNREYVLQIKNLKSQLQM